MMLLYKLSFLLTIYTCGVSTRHGWSYNDIEGWGGDCNNGRMQSPINIDPNTSVNAKYQKFHITTKYATLYNNGHTVDIEFPKTETILTGGGLPSTYRLDNIHFHWGSEHTIASERAPLEVHLVFFDVQYKNVEEAVKNNGVAVLGVLANNVTECNPSNSWMTIGNQILGIIQAKGDEVFVPSHIDIDEFLPSSKTFYRYIGSLTTPKCSEHVLWTVFESKISVCNQIIDVIKSIHDVTGEPMEETFRPVQPLNGRQVFKYVQPDDDKVNHDTNNGSWSYDNVVSWGGVCNTGKMQSPIDIDPDTTIKMKYEQLFISNVDRYECATLHNNGHTVEIQLPKAEITVSGGALPSTYRLHNIHFHWGSEHTIVSERAALEIHLVFFDVKYKDLDEAVKNNGLAVFGVLANNVTHCDNPSSWSTIGNQVTGIIKAKGAEILLRNHIKLNDFLPSSKTFYRYDGSLTTPKCSENVLWTVFMSKISVCNKIIDAIKSIHDINGKRMETTFRPVQPLNGRKVFLMQEEVKDPYVNKYYPMGFFN